MQSEYEESFLYDTPGGTKKYSGNNSLYYLNYIIPLHAMTCLQEQGQHLGLLEQCLAIVMNELNVYKNCSVIQQLYWLVYGCIIQDSRVSMVQLRCFIPNEFISTTAVHRKLFYFLLCYLLHLCYMDSGNSRFFPIL